MGLGITHFCCHMPIYEYWWPKKLFSRWPLSEYFKNFISFKHIAEWTSIIAKEVWSYTAFIGDTLYKLSFLTPAPQTLPAKSAKKRKRETIFKMTKIKASVFIPFSFKIYQVEAQ